MINYLLRTPCLLTSFPQPRKGKGLTCCRKRSLPFSTSSSAFHQVKKAKVVTTDSNPMNSQIEFKRDLELQKAVQSKINVFHSVNRQHFSIWGWKHKGQEKREWRHKHGGLDGAWKEVCHRLKVCRLIKNRESACKSRIKKKLVTESMLKQAELLQKEKHDLDGQVLS